MLTQNRNMDTRRDVFHAIADPTRREILGLVAAHPQNLNSIASNFGISRPAISQQIKILVECGLIDIQQKGRERICEVKPQKLAEVTDWLEGFRKQWEQRFSELDELLEKMKKEVTDYHKTPKK